MIQVNLINFLTYLASRNCVPVRYGRLTVYYSPVVMRVMGMEVKHSDHTQRFVRVGR